MRIITPSILSVLMLMSCGRIEGGDYAAKAVVEASIASIHQDILAGKMSCLNVVDAYIDRIEVYDQSTGLNAITYKNYKNAREIASKTDTYLRTRKADVSDVADKTLFCVPMLVKDNIDVKGFPTTAGSKMLLENFPPDDALIITRLKNQGAIVLAKTNMAEWAFSPKRTKSSSAGITKNAYNLDHVPAGSSGGTASGIAASFALVGLGTDTGNSVRGPSSHLSLVGMRSAHGFIPLDGIVPLIMSSDVVGPMTRNVEDNLLMLTAMAGPKPSSLAIGMQKNFLENRRIGVARDLSQSSDMDVEVAALFTKAITDLKEKGAIVIEDFYIKNFKQHDEILWYCLSFRKDVHDYLTQDGMSPAITDPYEAYLAGVYSDYTKPAWGNFGEGNTKVAKRLDGTICGDLSKNELRQAIKSDILSDMKAQNIDVLIYPSWNYPAAKLDRAEEDYKGDNSQILAPVTGLPAITVPMGFTKNNLPIGLQILGIDNSEALLYQISYAYEQATHHRRAPETFPVLVK